MADLQSCPLKSCPLSFSVLGDRACIYLDDTSINNLYVSVGEGLVDSILHVGKHRFLVLTDTASVNLPDLIVPMVNFSMDKLESLLNEAQANYNELVLLTTPCW